MVAMKARGAGGADSTDVVTAKTFAADAPATVKAATDVAADDMILDIGPETGSPPAAQLKSVGTIVWNRPGGVLSLTPLKMAPSNRRAIAEVGLQHRGRRRHAGRHRQIRHRQTRGHISTGGGAF